MLLYMLWFGSVLHFIGEEKNIPYRVYRNIEYCVSRTSKEKYKILNQFTFFGKHIT